MPISWNNNNGQTNGATPVDVVAAPATGAQRTIPIGGLSVHNVDSVSTNDLTVQIVDAGPVTRVIEVSSNMALLATYTNSTVINLGTTDQKLQIVLGGAVTTTEMDYVVSFLEIT